MQEYLIKLWDLPTRLVHWSLVVLVAAAFASGLAGGNWMVWHGRFGLAILGLLAFRLIWGLVGSTYARFSQFVRGPTSIRAYLRGRWHGIGHNPLGAVSVLTLLTLLLGQTLTGLVANDDIAFQGPLHALVSTSVSDWMSGLHRQAIWALGALIILHIGATLFYTLVHKDDMITPMLSGYKRIPDPGARPARGGGPLALLVALAFAIAVVWAAAGGLLPPTSPATTTTTPNW